VSTPAITAARHERLRDAPVTCCNARRRREGDAMHAAADTPATCENCGTALQGAYCHACGQSGHNPLHNLAHALEEVFESFWHLDGRVFRTLRDLLVPGRVACNYLAGQRVRYIPPLRLFLVLIVLTFFVGRLTVGGETDARAASSTHAGAVHVGKGSSSFDNAGTEAEVKRTLDETLKGIAEAKKKVPLMAPALARAETEARNKAAVRIAQLRSANRSATKAQGVNFSVGAGDATAAGSSPKDDEAEVARSMDRFVRSINGARLADPKQPWDAATNPVDVPWLPAFGDRWFNHRIANFMENVHSIDRNGAGLLGELMLAAVPSALFVLVPVFALMLKLLYIGSGRSYLEHLMIALYSHAFLLLTLFASFVLALLPITAGITVPLTLLLWGWAGVYLLLMQHRVYGQIWPITVGKFLVVAFLYQFLIVGAALYIVFAGLTSGH
jgi:hypothetical protein